MAQLGEESLLEKLLKSRYPLTYYLSRQQQFVKVYSTIQTGAVPARPSESTIIVGQKRKAPLPPPSCFNVPDTLDFNASEYEMDQNTELEDDASREYDETLLLKNIDNRINGTNSDIINAKNSSSIHLEFSPYEYDSPVEKAIQRGLNIINK